MISNRYFSLISSMKKTSTPASTLNTGLVSVYNADNNANDALGTYNGTAIGGLTYSTGKINQAFNFNGTTSYIQLPNDSLQLTNNWSFSFWMNRKSATTSTIINNWYNGATPKGYLLFILNGTLTFRMWNNGAKFCDYSAAMGGANIWQNVVVVNTLTSSKIYIDGNLINSTTFTSNTPNYYSSTYPLIGARKYDTSPPDQLLESGCQLDSINFWQKELSASEITELYNSGNGKQYPF